MAFQDFDQISQRRKLERQQRLKKRLSIAVSSIVFVLLVAAAAFCVVKYKNNQDTAARKDSDSQSPGPSKPSAAEEEVKAVCAGTDYKQTCEDSILKAVAKNSSPQPKDIVKASFAVASDEINRVSKC